MVITSEAQICQKNIREGNTSTSQVNIPDVNDKDCTIDNQKPTFESLRRGSSSNRESIQETSDAEDDKSSTNKNVRHVLPTWETYKSVESSQSDSLTLRKIHHHVSENSKSSPAFEAATKKQKSRPSFLFIPDESVSEDCSSKGAAESKVEVTELDVQETQSKPCILGSEKSAREMDISSEGNVKFHSISRTIIVNTLHVAETQQDSKVSSRRSSKTRVGKASTVTGTSHSIGKITKTTKNNLHSAPELSIQNARYNNTTMKDTNRHIINSKTVTYLDAEDTHFAQEQVPSPFVSEDCEEKQKVKKISDGSIPKAKSNISPMRKRIDSAMSLKREKSSLADNDVGSHVITMAKRNSHVGTNKSNALLKTHVKSSCEKVETNQMGMDTDMKNKNDSQRINEITTKFPDNAKTTFKRLVTSTPKLSDIKGSWQSCTPSYSCLRRPVSQKSSQKKNNVENCTKIEVKNLVRSESYVIVGKHNNNQVRSERVSENCFPPQQNMGKKSQVSTNANNQVFMQKQSSCLQKAVPSEHSRKKTTLPDDEHPETKPSVRSVSASKSLSKTERIDSAYYDCDKTEIIIHPTIQAIRSKMRLIEKTRKEVERLSQATREIIKESWSDDIQLSDDQISNIVQFKILEDEKREQNITDTVLRNYVDEKQPYKSRPSVVENKRGKYTPRKTQAAVKSSPPKNSPGANKYVSVTNNHDIFKQKMSYSKSQTLSRTQSMSRTMSRSSSGSSRTIKSRSQTSSVKSSRPKAFLSSSNVQEKRKPSTNVSTQSSTAAKKSISNMMGVLSMINSPPKVEKNYIQLNIIRAREKQPRSKVSGHKQSKTTTKSRASVATIEPKETKTSPTVNTAETADMDIIRIINEQTKQPCNSFVRKKSDIIINLPNLSPTLGTGSSKLSYTSHKVVTTTQKSVPKTLPLSRVPASTKFTSTTSSETPAVSLRTGRERFPDEKVSKRGRKPSEKSTERSSFGKESNQSRAHEILPKNDNIHSVTKTCITSHVNESKVLHHTQRQISPVPYRSRKTNDVCRRENVKSNEIVQSETKTTRKNVVSSDESVRSKRIPSRSKDEVDSSLERNHFKNNKSLVARVSRKSGNLRLPGSRDASVPPVNEPSTLNNTDNVRNRSSTPDTLKPKYQNFDLHSYQKKDNHPKSRGSEKKLSHTRTRYTAPDLREMRKHDSILTDVENKKVISASEVVGKLDHTEHSRFGKSEQINAEEPSTGLCTMPLKGKTTDTTKRVDILRLKNTPNTTSKFSSVARAKIDCGQNSERRIKKRDFMRTDPKTSDAEFKKGDIFSRRSRSRTPITFTRLVDNPNHVESTQIDSNLIGKTKKSQPKITSGSSKFEYSVNIDAVQTLGEVREKIAPLSFSRRSMTSSSIFQKDHYRKRDGSLTSTKTLNNSLVDDSKTRMSIRNPQETQKKEKSGVNVYFENSGRRKDPSSQTLRRTSNTSDLPQKEELVSKSKVAFTPAETNVQHQYSKRLRYPSCKLRSNVTGKAATASDITNNLQTVTIHSRHNIHQEFTTTSPDTIKYNITETADTDKLTFRKQSKELLKSEVQGDFPETPDFVLDATGANPTNANVVALSIEEFPYTKYPMNDKSIPKLTSSQKLKSPVGSILQNETSDDDTLVIGDISQGIAVIIRPKSKVFSENETKKSQKSHQNINRELNETWDDKINQSKSMPFSVSQDSQRLSSESCRDVDKQIQNISHEVVNTEATSISLSDRKFAESDHIGKLNREAIYLSDDNLGSLETNDIQDFRDSISCTREDNALKNAREENDYKRVEPHSDPAIRHPLVHAITLLTRNRKGGDETVGSSTNEGSTASLICGNDAAFLTSSDSDKN